MAKTTSNEELATRIEQLVREHIAESRRTAQQAVERAFASTTPARSTRSKSATKSAAVGRRRPPEEVAALGDRLYAAICTNPGEGMARLAAEIGASVRELHRPMTRLRRAGRIRSVGSRHLTRYFPMAAEAASA
jgi:hypothetical protein